MRKGTRWLPAVLAATTLAAAGGVRAEDPPRCSLRMRDVAPEAGLDFVHDRGAGGAKHLPETMGGGLAWLDYDGDGRLDLYAVQSGPYPPDASSRAANRLYRNLGDRRFAEVTAAAGAGDRGCGQGAVASDVDGDGDADLYVTNIGRDVLLRNRGDGTFEDATGAAGLGLDGWSSSAALADADGDGDLDLYVSRYLDYAPDHGLYCGDPERGELEYCDPSLFTGATDAFYRQEDGGIFAEETRTAGFAAATGRGLGVLWTDLDGDGAPDVYVANDLDPNLLFANRGGTFRDESLLSGAAVNRDGAAEAGMGVAVADVDGDLAPDLAVTNFDVETNTLYRNLGPLFFRDDSAVSGFGLPSFNRLAFGLVAADLDRDGAIDFYVANGHIFERPKRENVFYEQPDQVLLGDGAGGFRALDCAWLRAAPTVARGLAAADFDRDGDVDLAVQANGGPLALLENRSPDAPWLGVELRGDGGNTEGVGARAVLTAGGRRQVRWIVAGDSYQSSSERRALFGLGTDGPIEVDVEVEVEIRWPSGRRQRLAGPPAGHYLRLYDRRYDP